jgi:hypothetical protein
VRRRGDAHQLPARKLADADHHVGLLHLHRQVLAADVVELIGAMDGVRQVAGGEPLHQHAHAGAGIAEVHMQVP